MLFLACIAGVNGEGLGRRELREKGTERRKTVPMPIHAWYTGYAIFISTTNEGVRGKKPQVTSDKLLDSPLNCLVFTLETKGEFDVTSRVTWGLIPRTSSNIYITMQVTNSQFN